MRRLLSILVVAACFVLIPATAASRTPSYSALLRRPARTWTARRQRRRCGGPGRLRVGIDGLTASGKTSFGHELADLICHAGRPVLRASLDDFKRPWRDRHLYDRESGEGYYRNAFDYEAVRRLLLKPAGVDESGECVLCAIDPLTQEDHTNVVTWTALDAVLIVDGVFAFRPEINQFWDFRLGWTSTLSWPCGGECRATAPGRERTRNGCTGSGT
jgi:hypothetical protein